MDTRDGSIYYEGSSAFVELTDADRPYLRPMSHHPTPAQRARGKVGRNEPCPCGSGRKFKKCCAWRSP